MKFPSRIAGIPCLIRVDYFCPAVPDRLQGPAEDAIEGSAEEFDFTILDRRGNPAHWLSEKVTEKDIIRLSEEYQLMLLGEELLNG